MILEQEYEVLLANNGQDALESNDLETAFKEAHSLKGTYGNLSPLRNKVEMDYTPNYQKLVELFNKLKALQ